MSVKMMTSRSNFSTWALYIHRLLNQTSYKSYSRGRNRWLGFFLRCLYFSAAMSLILAIQTVTPLKVTDPRLSRKISVRDPTGSGVFRRRLQTVLYFKSVSEEDSGWAVVGWIKESLGTALVEQPLLGGRLRRIEDSEEEFELVSNDCGVRLMEARTSMTLPEFLEQENREAQEADLLVFWKDIEEQDLQLSPLFYVQVTNFESGGYSIGISCSILLVDPIGMATFLKRWATIHNALLSEKDLSKRPIFYLQTLRRLSDTPSVELITSDTARNRAGAKIFNVAGNLNADNKICMRAVATVCMEKAEGRRGGAKGVGKYWLLLKEVKPESIKIEACSSKEKEEEKIAPSVLSGLNELRWEDLGVDEVGFFKGNRPVHVSFWIGSLHDDGVVIVTPSSSDEGGCSGMNVVVAAPW